MGTSHRGMTAGMLVAAAGNLASRVTGLARDIVLARAFGTSGIWSAFLVAFTAPNMLRRLFGEGALSEAFVPLYNQELTTENRAAADALACTILGLSILVLAGVSVLAAGGTMLFSLWVDDPYSELILWLVPCLMPYALFICAAGFLSGVLNSLRHFAAPAYAPMILNACFIVAGLWVCPQIDTIVGLTGAVLVAGVLQLAVLFPVLARLAFSWRPRWPQWRLHLSRLWDRLLPAVLAAGVYQLNLFCDRLFACWLDARLLEGHAVASLYYSERLIYLPIGVFAVALSAACLPQMSRAFAAGADAEMRSALGYAVRQVLFLTLPCVAMLLILGDEMIALLFLRGRFDAISAGHTLAALTFYAPGVPAFAALKIVRSGYYSRQDYRTPLRLSAICLGLNVLLNLLLIVPLQQRGLALATSISSFVNVSALALLLVRRSSVPVDARGFAVGIARLMAGAAISAVVVMAVSGALATGDDLDGRLLAVICPGAAGAAAYIGVTLALGGEEPREIWAVLRHRRRG